MTEISGSAPEAKAAESGDVSAAFDDFMRAFEAFKDTNDERLSEIETKLTADVVTTDKLDRINKALDELTLKGRRPPLSAERGAAFRAQAGVRELCARRRRGRLSQAGT